jgi:hypothetical protein
MKQVLVVQGKAAVVFFRRLLEPDLGHEVEVVSGGIWANEVARSGRQKVANRYVTGLVVDAESLDPLRIQWTRWLNEKFLMQKGPPEMWRVFVVVPEVEALYFQSEEVLRQVLEHPLTPEQRERARTEPRQVLIEASGWEDRYGLEKNLGARLEQVDLSPLRSLPLREEIVSFYRTRPEYLRRFLEMEPSERREALGPMAPESW